MASISGGDKLRAKLEELSRQVTKKSRLRVGFLEGAAYPDGTPIAQIAALQNDGAPAVGIPPRPFFTNMVRDKSPDWGDSLAEVLKENDYDADLALNLMGEGIAGQLMESIIETDSPPLAPLTLLVRQWKRDHPGEEINGTIVHGLRSQLAKGPPDPTGISTEPLVDTGAMLHAVSPENHPWEVE